MPVANRLAGANDGRARARLVVAEDHAEVREALRGALAADHDVVALVADGEAAIAAAVQLRPDMVLLDISMPVLGGLPAARKIKQRLPGVKVVFVTAYADPLYVEEALRIGVDGYVLKASLHSELGPAVARVLAGGSYWTAAVAGA